MKNLPKDICHKILVFFYGFLYSYVSVDVFFVNVFQIIFIHVLYRWVLVCYVF